MLQCRERQRCTNSSHLAGLLAITSSARAAIAGTVRPSIHAKGLDTAPYGFGETRVATLALLTLTALSGWCSCGVVITKFSAHAVTFRSSPTVVADTPMSGSASTRILAGKPPRAMCSAGMLLGLYRIWAPSPFVQDFCAARAAIGHAAAPPSSVMNSRRLIRSPGRRRRAALAERTGTECHRRL
jgi:hypothetical protein